MSIKINLGENCKLNHLQHNVSIICFFESPPEKCQRAHASSYKREREIEIKLTAKITASIKANRKKYEA